MAAQRAKCTKVLHMWTALAAEQEQSFKLFFPNRQKRACSFYRKMNGKLGLFSILTHIFMQSKVLKLKLSRSSIEIIHTLVCWTPCRDKDSKRSLEKVMIRTISKSVSARPLNLYTLLRVLIKKETWPVWNGVVNDFIFNLRLWLGYNFETFFLVFKLTVSWNVSCS